MSERPEDLQDDLLSARLKSAFDTTPSRLSSCLERLSALGLRSGIPERRAALPWREVGPRLIGVALLLTLVAGVVPRLWALFMNPPSLDSQAQGVASMLGASGALSSLMLPIGVLLGVEALRGAPTVRSWLR